MVTYAEFTNKNNQKLQRNLDKIINHLDYIINANTYLNKQVGGEETKKGTQNSDTSSNTSTTATTAGNKTGNETGNETGQSTTVASGTKTGSTLEEDAAGTTTITPAGTTTITPEEQKEVPTLTEIVVGTILKIEGKNHLVRTRDEINGTPWIHYIEIKPSYTETTTPATGIKQNDLLEKISARAVTIVPNDDPSIKIEEAQKQLIKLSDDFLKEKLGIKKVTIPDINMKKLTTIKDTIKSLKEDIQKAEDDKKTATEALETQKTDSKTKIEELEKQIQQKSSEGGLKAQDIAHLEDEKTALLGHLKELTDQQEESNKKIEELNGILDSITDL